MNHLYSERTHQTQTLAPIAAKSDVELLQKTLKANLLCIEGLYGALHAPNPRYKAVRKSKEFVETGLSYWRPAGCRCSALRSE